MLCLNDMAEMSSAPTFQLNLTNRDLCRKPVAGSIVLALSRKFFKMSLRLSGLVFANFLATFLSKHTNVCFTSIWSTEFFQNSLSSETVHGLFSRYRWNFLEEFFGQFQTCKLNMKIWYCKIRYENLRRKATVYS